MASEYHVTESQRKQHKMTKREKVHTWRRLGQTSSGHEPRRPRFTFSVKPKVT